MNSDNSIRLKRINLHVLGRGKKQQVILTIHNEVVRQHIQEDMLPDGRAFVHLDIEGNKYLDIVYPYDAWDQLNSFFTNSEKYIDTSDEVFRNISNNREYKLK